MMMQTALTENYQWFKDNLPLLLKDYQDKYLAIKDQKVIGEYNSFHDAINDMKEKEEPGKYIIQLCSIDTSKVLNVFHSRVSFN
jgi:hypothetical protein